MAADASGNRGQLPDPMARLHPPAVSEKLVRVFASEELSKLGRAERLVLPACCAASARSARARRSYERIMDIS